MDVRTLIYILKRLSTAAQSAAATVQVDPPLTPGEMMIIGLLARQKKPLSIKEIVSQTGLVQSWASKSVQGLKKRGWVTTKSHPEDRRVTYVTATPEVIAGAAAFFATDASGIIADLLPDATKAELQSIQRGLDTLGSLLKRNAPDLSTD